MKNHGRAGTMAASLTLACLGLLTGCETDATEPCPQHQVYDSLPQANNGQWTSVGYLPGGFGYSSARKVQLLEGGVGYALGSDTNSIADDPAFLRTTNGGATWTDLSPYDYLRNARFPDANTGYGLDDQDRLFKTTDGGVHWILKGEKKYYSLYFLDANRGWAKAQEGIWRTTNGGESWIAPVAGLPHSLVATPALYFVDAARGWLTATSYVGGSLQGVLMSTSDAGVTWKPIQAPAAAEFHSMFFLDSNAGWLSATGAVFHTVNGGATWSSSQGADWGKVGSLRFLNANEGFAVDDRGGMLRTADGGASWERRQLPTTRALTSVDFVDTQHGWAGGSGVLFRTVDGGTTWTLLSEFMPVQDIRFFSASTGWVSTLFGLYRTTDGGASWALQFGFPMAWDFHFPTAGEGWVVGRRGMILKTTDGGSSWRVPANVASGVLRTVYFTDPSTGWMAQENTILRTTNAGATWGVPQNVLGGIRALHFVDGSTGWAVGRGGAIRKTADGGVTWAPQSSGTSEDLLSVHFVDGMTGFISGEGGLLLKTQDGGASWTRLNSGVYLPLNRVVFLDAQTGYAVGGGRSQAIDTTVRIAAAKGPRVPRMARAGFGADWEEALLKQVGQQVGGMLQERWAGGMHGYDCPRDPGAPVYRVILRTTDGGLTWTREHVDRDYPWGSVSCAPSGRCLALGQGIWIRN
ncbi:MAG: hypothetical protein K0Q91_1742 [Fibrobacteria bacterium]|jgi:photosystem II stability/assembly factor-like uncharacterized protein|nr:hypothetical protein [Fibrobacteria bacterium]